MRERLIEALVGAYGRLARGGLLRRPRARRTFEAAYVLYKRLLEAGPVAGLETLVEPGSIVIDAGANIGFFSVRFGRWVGPRGRVIAIEPAPANFRSLRERTARAGLGDVVECVGAVAADFEGEARLELNPLHPGDHRLGELGEPVPAVTIDSLVAGDGRPVALIKADVQGAEAMVLAGAMRTIAAHRPAIFLELDDAALRRLGSSSAELLATLAALGYAARRLDRGGIGPPAAPEGLVAASAEGYVDALFVPDAGATG